MVSTELGPAEEILRAAIGLIGGECCRRQLERAGPIAMGRGDLGCQQPEQAWHGRLLAGPGDEAAPDRLLPAAEQPLQVIEQPWRRTRPAFRRPVPSGPGARAPGMPGSIR